MADLHGQLVGRHGVGQGGPLGVARRIHVVHVFEIRAVPTNAHVQSVADVDGVDGAGVDLPQLRDLLLQARVRFVRRSRRVAAGTEIEMGQPVTAGLLTVRDLVEPVLHIRGELVIDVLGEFRLQQLDDRERQPRWNQGATALVDVSTVDDGGDDARIG